MKVAIIQDCRPSQKKKNGLKSSLFSTEWFIYKRLFSNKQLNYKFNQTTKSSTKSKEAQISNNLLETNYFTKETMLKGYFLGCLRNPNLLPGF